jgi:hypothetical protein
MAKALGREPKVVDPQRALPEAKAQRNFTDADSRIMKDGATQGYVQGYNLQQLVAMLLEVEKNTGEKPAKASADAGTLAQRT